MGGKPSKKGDSKAGIIVEERSPCLKGATIATSATSASVDRLHKTPSNNWSGSKSSFPGPPAPPVGPKPLSGMRPVGRPAKPAAQASGDVALDTVEPRVPIGSSEEPPTPAKALSLDVTDDEFIQLVNEAFGKDVAPALVSSKWDRRVEALKNVALTLKGQKLASKNSTCFRATCLVLHRSMRDKVLPVLLEAHDLLRRVFEQAGPILSEVELKQALDSLVSHSLAKLGDSNIRLHDSAKATIIFAAEQKYYGLPRVFVRLREHMSNGNRGHMRAKQLNGVIDTVCGLVENFPGRRTTISDDYQEWEESQLWNQDTIWPFMQEGLDDVVFPRTRLRAVELAVTVFSILGREALAPHIETLRPAVRNLLLQRFEEAEQGPDVNPEIEDVKSPRGELRATILTPKDADAGASIARSVSIKPPSTPYASKRPSPRKSKRVDTPAHQSQGGGRPQAVEPSKPSRHWRTVPAIIEEQKWKSSLNELEEDMMDAILEEAGLVFGKGDKVSIGMEEELEFLGLERDLCRGMPVVCC